MVLTIVGEYAISLHVSFLGRCAGAILPSFSGTLTFAVSSIILAVAIGVVVVGAKTTAPKS